MEHGKCAMEKVSKPYKKRQIPYGKLKRLIRADDLCKFKKELSKDVKSVTKFSESKLAELKKGADEESIGNTKEIINDLRDLSSYIETNAYTLRKLNDLYDRKNESDGSEKYVKRLKKWKLMVEEIKQLCSKLNSKSRKEYKHVEKYWISEKDAVFMKMGLARNMKGEMKMFKEGEISTVYFDDAGFQVYNGLLCGIENVNAVKICWEGGSKIVKIEQEMNETQSSFYINERDVLEYIKGTDVFSRIEELNVKKGEEGNGGPERLRSVYDSIQRTIKENKLRPMVRVICKRLMIESSGISVALETQIAMIRECSSYEASSGVSPRQWRRDDIEGSWPYGRVKMDDIIRFPYSVLRISYDSMAPWLSGLLGDCGADRVDSFSKSLHGVAGLFKGAEPTPYWMARVLPDEPSSSLPSEINLAPTPVQPIAIPVRVEPKVFFANERTFLSWVQFAIFLGGIGTAMLGLGDKNASVCGLLLIIVAAIFSVYSLYLFHWRLRRIRERDPGPYDDRYGPTVLVFVFMLAVLLACIFKMPLRHGYRLN